MIKDISMISHRGTRYEMEDNSCLAKKFGGNVDWIFGGVFDGHGGPDVADFAARNIRRLFLTKIMDGMTETEAFRKSYLEISERKGFEMVGCCALSFFAKGNELYVANSSDCRMVMVYKKRVDQITKDHTLCDLEEEERILRAGGELKESASFKGDFGLRPTRSLGYHYLKSIGIIAEPDVFSRVIPDIPDIYLVAATDGVWEKIKNDDLVEIAKVSRSAREMAGKILSLLLNLYSHTSLDNIALIIAKT